MLGVGKDWNKGSSAWQTMGGPFTPEQRNGVLFYFIWEMLNSRRFEMRLRFPACEGSYLPLLAY